MMCFIRRHSHPAQLSFSPLGVVISCVVTMYMISVSTCNSNSTNTVTVPATGKFMMYYKKTLPSDLSGCWSESVKEKFRCVQLCARNISCSAVFTEYMTNKNNTIMSNVSIDGNKTYDYGYVYECHFCRDVWNISSLGNGTDQYAVSKFGGRGKPTPSINGTVSDGVVDLHLGHLAVSYSCPGNGKEFKLAYSEETGEWPILSQSCQNSLCDVESLEGVMVSMSRPSPDTYWLHPHCTTDQRAHGHVQCMDGVWEEFDGLRRICIPKTCQSLNSKGRSVYQGDENRTRKGKKCQKWINILPHVHFYTSKNFQEDESRAAAGNSCRDPAKNGFVWCYTMNIFVRWESCTVPTCE